MADSTQEVYTRVMKQYSNYLGKSIEEIYADALQEEKGNVFFHERQYRADLIKYNNYLKKRVDPLTHEKYIWSQLNHSLNPMKYENLK